MRDEPESRIQARFPETRWSLVRAAGSTGSSRADRALDEICRSYWAPLYAFVRRNGRSREAAEDLTQDFLAALLAKDSFLSIREGGGRLRSYLLAALKNFLIDQARKESAAKRGGTISFLPVNGEGIDDTLTDSEETPAEAFERQWVWQLMDEAMVRLEDDYRRNGKGELFEAFVPFLQGDAGSKLREVGAALGLRESAVKVAIFRFRERYRSHFEQAVAETVDGQDELEDELRFVRAVLERA
ncbi:MAG: sigma-70 family RNA polymerase sigma factor [Verrucomicrobiota bacterium JB023]|nr:sigma-70 family RNA polymerase sigma factor [Verrucomicrobiota bacterium JB023]